MSVGIMKIVIHANHAILATLHIFTSFIVFLSLPLTPIKLKSVLGLFQLVTTTVLDWAYLEAAHSRVPTEQVKIAHYHYVFLNIKEQLLMMVTHNSCEANKEPAYNSVASCACDLTIQNCLVTLSFSSTYDLGIFG